MTSLRDLILRINSSSPSSSQHSLGGNKMIYHHLDSLVASSAAARMALSWQAVSTEPRRELLAAASTGCDFLICLVV
jgi:hypothetical protein